MLSKDFRITHTTAKKLLQEMYRTGKSVEELVEGREDEFRVLTYEETEEAVNKVIATNPKAVADYKKSFTGE